MEKYKSLMTNVVLLALSALATRLMSFILMPLYTLYMSSNEYGVMDMSIILFNAVFPALTLMISDGVLRYVLDCPEDAIFYITEGTIIVSCSCVIVFIFSPILSLQIFGGLNKYWWLVVISYCAGAFPAFMGVVARSVNQLRLMTWASIVASVTLAITSYVFVAYMHLGVRGYFFSYIIGNLASILIYTCIGKQYRYIDLKIWWKKRHRQRELFLYSIPLIPNSLIGSAGTIISRFVITGLMGISYSGLYAAASKIPNLLNVIQQLFSQAWQISAFQEFRNNGLKHFYEVVWRFYHALMAVGSSVVILFAPWLASILMQRSFYSAWTLIPLLVVGFYIGSLANFLGTIHQAFMNTKPLMVTSIVGMILTILVTVCLVPASGMIGAAIGVVVSNFVVLLIRIFDTRRLLPFDMGGVTLLSTIILLTLQSILPFYNNNYSRMINILLTTMLIIVHGFIIIRILKDNLKKAKD